MLISTLGVVILWFGWYGFNPGSTLAIVGYSKVSAKVAVTTSISAATGALTCTFFSKATTGKYDLMLTLNGILAGLVSVTAACAVVEPWGAFIIGFVGAFVFMGLAKLLKFLHIDDPLDAFPIHGGCGMWGLLVSGIPGIVSDKSVGWVYGTNNDAVLRGEQFGVQLVGMICIALWTTVTSSIMFFGIKYTIGLRVLPEIEEAGLDTSEHGGIAFFDAPAKFTDLELAVAQKTAALEGDIKASVQV
jgi:Amt family ammonium transporter